MRKVWKVDVSGYNASLSDTNNLFLQCDLISEGVDGVNIGLTGKYQKEAE